MRRASTFIRIFFRGNCRNIYLRRNSHSPNKLVTSLEPHAISTNFGTLPGENLQNHSDIKVSIAIFKDVRHCINRPTSKSVNLQSKRGVAGRTCLLSFSPRFRNVCVYRKRKRFRKPALKVHKMCQRA